MLYLLTNICCNIKQLVRYATSTLKELFVFIPVYKFDIIIVRLNRYSKKIGYENMKTKAISRKKEVKKQNKNFILRESKQKKKCN